MKHLTKFILVFVLVLCLVVSKAYSDDRPTGLSLSLPGLQASHSTQDYDLIIPPQYKVRKEHHQAFVNGERNTIVFTHLEKNKQGKLFEKGSIVIASFSTPMPDRKFNTRFHAKLTHEFLSINSNKDIIHHSIYNKDEMMISHISLVEKRWIPNLGETKAIKVTYIVTSYSSATQRSHSDFVSIIYVIEPNKDLTEQIEAILTLIDSIMPI